MQPDWYLDWTNREVAIIASGPSAKKSGHAALRGKIPIIAIKENVEIAPWADVVYGCDAAWWKNRQGLPEFKGLKVTWKGDTIHPPPPYSDIRRVEIDACSNELSFQAGKLGSGGNSGFQALNLAVQFGAKRILLIGFDAHDRSGVHWYGRNNWPQANNPDENNFRRWRIAFELATPKLRDAGVEVFNASDSSALKCFERHKVESAMAVWKI